MAIKRIDSYLNIPALKGEHEQLSKFLIDDYNSIVKLFNAISKAKGSSTMSQIVEDSKKLDTAIKETTKSSSELEKQKQKLLELEKKEAQQIAFTKQQIADKNKELKIQALNETVVAGSIEASRAKVKELAAQRDVLNLSTEKGKQKALELNAAIDQENEFIRVNSSLLEKQKINVGNYAGSFEKAFSVLGTELSDLKQKIANTSKDSAGFDALNKKATLLEKIIGGLDQSFSTTRQELRSFTEAAKQLGTEFGITSKEFQAFAGEVAGRKDELDDIQKTINFQSSDTKYLDGVVNAVQGIVGAYGAYQAATVLLGEDNKELQESMQKLQAVLTLVTSVQAVANALQSESGTIQVALAAKAGFLAAAEKLAAIATGERAVATTAAALSTEAAVVADAELAVVASEAAIAMEAEAVGAASLAGGLDAVVVSEGAVAAGASTMATAIAATGIGLIIIAVAVGIYKLVTALQDWSAKTQSVKDANLALSDTLKQLIEDTKAFDSANRLSAQKELENLDKLIAKRKALGTTQGEALALDKQSAAARLKATSQEVAANKITEESLAKKQESLRIAAGAVVEQQAVEERYVEYVKQHGDEGYKKTMEGLAKEKEIFKKNYDLKAADYQRDADIFKANEDAKQQDDLLTNQAIKLNADEQRKFILETAKIEADAQTGKNERILNNDRSTLEQRVSALQSNLQQRLKIIKAENDAVQSDPTVSDTDKSLSSKKAAADKITATKENDKQIFDIRQSFRLREIAAQTEINKLELQKVYDQNKALADNDLLSFNQRISAEKDFVKAKNDLNDADYKKQLADAGINEEEIAKLIADPTYKVKSSNKTAKEIEAITAIHYATQQQIVLEGEQSTTEIVLSEYAKQVQANKDAFDQIDLQYQQHFLTASKSYTEEVTALNTALKTGEISYEKYQIKRKAIDEKNAKAITKIELEEIQKQIAAIKYSPDDLIKSKQEFTNAQQKLSQAVTDTEQTEAARQVAIAKKKYEDLQKLDAQYTGLIQKQQGLIRSSSDEDAAEDLRRSSYLTEQKKQLAQEIFDFTSQLIEAGFENELNVLEEKQKKDDETYAKEVENITNSTLSQQQKADELAILAKEKEVRDAEMDRKKKEVQIRQAKFEKAKTIVEIAFATALAIQRAVAEFPLTGGMPFAAIAAAIGAVQIAAVLARPIPQYADGIENNPVAHLGIYGEAGKELISKPGQQPFIADRPTLDFLPVGTSIKPLNSDELNQVMHYGLLQSMANGLGWIKHESKKRNEVVDALDRQTKQLSAAFRKPVTTSNRRDARDINWLNYLQRNIYN